MRFLSAAGLVMVLAGLSSYYVIGELSFFSVANLAGGPLVLVAAGVIEARRFRGFTGRRARRVVVRWALVCAGVFAVVVGLNALALRWTTTIDLTRARQYTLSEQTLALCDTLRAEVGETRPEVLLFEDALIAKDVRLLIQAYDAHCPVRTRELLASDAPPEALRILESYETTVVACWKERCEYVGYPSEENITNGLLRLVRQTRPLVYFTVGHGEVDLASERSHGFTGLTEALRNEGIDLRALPGAAEAEIPADASLVVVAAPARNWLEAEIAALEAYLEGGGRLLALLEPGDTTNLEEMLTRWGFGLPSAVIADRQSSALLEEPRPVSLVVNSFSVRHDITRSMNPRTMVVMPSARPVFAARKPQPSDDLEALVFSSRRAWAEVDIDGALSGREIAPDADDITSGEIPIVASGRYPRGEGIEARIVVIGDRDFASNRWIRALYNLDLVLNAVLWLAEDEQHLAIRPKIWTPDTQPLPLETTLTYFYSLAFALPEALLLLGILAWYRQRG